MPRDRTTDQQTIYELRKTIGKLIIENMKLKNEVSKCVSVLIDEEL